MPVISWKNCKLGRIRGESSSTIVSKLFTLSDYGFVVRRLNPYYQKSISVSIVRLREPVDDRKTDLEVLIRTSLCVCLFSLFIRHIKITEDLSNDKVALRNQWLP